MIIQDKMQEIFNQLILNISFHNQEQLQNIQQQLFNILTIIHQELQIFQKNKDLEIQKYIHQKNQWKILHDQLKKGYKDELSIKQDRIRMYQIEIFQLNQELQFLQDLLKEQRQVEKEKSNQIQLLQKQQKKNDLKIMKKETQINQLNHIILNLRTQIQEFKRQNGELQDQNKKLVEQINNIHRQMQLQLKQYCNNLLIQYQNKNKEKKVDLDTVFKNFKNNLQKFLSSKKKEEKILVIMI